MRDACVFFRQAAFDVFFGVLGRDAEIGRRKTTGLNVAVFIQSGIFRRTGNGNFVVTAAVYDKTAFHAEFFERLCDRFDQSRVVNADDGIVGMRRIGQRAEDVEDGAGSESGTYRHHVFHGSVVELSKTECKPCSDKEFGRLFGVRGDIKSQGG